MSLRGDIKYHYYIILYISKSNLVIFYYLVCIFYCNSYPIDFYHFNGNHIIYSLLLTHIASRFMAEAYYLLLTKTIYIYIIVSFIVLVNIYNTRLENKQIYITDV